MNCLPVVGVTFTLTRRPRRSRRWRGRAEDDASSPQGSFITRKTRTSIELCASLEKPASGVKRPPGRRLLALAAAANCIGFQFE